MHALHGRVFGAASATECQPTINPNRKSCAKTKRPRTRNTFKTANEYAGVKALTSRASGGTPAAAAVATVGDALNRYWENDSGSGAGLRGGSYRLIKRADGYDMVLDRIAYTTDLTVSGRLHWNQLTGIVRGAVDLAGAPDRGHLMFSWSEGLADATATIAGTINGRLVAATCAAP